MVHNAMLIDKTERTIVRAPFCPAPCSVLTGQFSLSPKPLWFVTNKTAATTGKRLTRFSEPSWFKLPAVVASVMRG